MGASWAVPAVRAGGAVEEPLPSTPILTLGYFLLNPSAQRVIRLFSVSEPTAFQVAGNAAGGRIRLDAVVNGHLTGAHAQGAEGGGDGQDFGDEFHGVFF